MDIFITGIGSAVVKLGIIFYEVLSHVADLQIIICEGYRIIWYQVIHIRQLIVASGAGKIHNFYLGAAIDLCYNFVTRL